MSNSKNKKTALVSESNRFVIRLATHTDIPALIRLSISCFPLEMDHQLPWKLQEEWIDHLISGDFAELYVADAMHEIAGYVLITTCYSKYMEEESKRDKPFLTKLFTLAKSPSLLCSVLLEKAILMCAAMRHKIPDKGQELDKNGLRLIQLAVDTKYRRKGLGNTILQYVENRALYLNKDSVFLVVLPGNQDALSLYDRSGYCCGGTASKWLVYKKELRIMATIKEG